MRPAESGVLSMTVEQQLEAYKAMCAKEDARKAKNREYMEKNKEKVELANLRSRVRRNLLLEKARLAKLTVTEEEITLFLQANPKG